MMIGSVLADWQDITELGPGPFLEYITVLASGPCVYKEDF